MSQKKIHIFFLALAALLCLSSCALEEPIDTPQNSDGYIEFVARPVGFNNQVVETKGPANGLEQAVYSCYLLVFDNDPQSQNYGNLIQRSEASLNQPLKLNLKSGNVKACFLVNVTKTFAENIKGITRPEGSTENPNCYLNSAVLDITYADHTVADSDPEVNGIIGIPSVDFGGTIGTKKCLPMYGEWSGSVSGKSTIQVPIKRLFAKIAVDIKLVLASSGSQFGDAVQDWLKYTSFKLMSYELKNLPSKVKLVESDNQSSWVKDKDSDSFATSSDHVFMLGGLNQSITNNGSTTFYLYVPEYYLTALDSDGYKKQNSDVAPETYGKQEYKPLMFETGKKPIYITILGQYSPYALNKVNLTYDIYLGENETNSFTLKRNTCYTNTITITGANNSKDGSGTSIDHRVNAVTINDITIEKGESANCYIYTASGTYSFPTYKGAYTSLTEAKKNMCTGGVQVVNKAQTNFSDLTPVEITDLKYSDNEISFTLSTGTGGNVILELQDAAGNAVWSWHLWVLVLGENDDIGIADQTLPNGAVVMNRNLGSYTLTTAVSEGIGLYYQYGNKNPYFDESKTYVGSAPNGTATWKSNDNTKTVNDPCPPGYQVPSNSVWSSTNTSFSHQTLDLTGLLYGGVLRIYNSPDAVYGPYSGRLENGTSKNTQYKGSQNLYIEDEVIGVSIYKFKQFNITANTTTQYGGFWTSNEGDAGKAIATIYKYAEIKFLDIWTSVSWKNGYVSRVNKNDYSYKTSLGSLERTSLKSALGTSTARNVENIENIQYNKTEGFQVRCVKTTSAVK